MKVLNYSEVETAISPICDLEDNTVIIVLDTKHVEDSSDETTLTFSFINTKSEIVKDVIRGIASNLPIIKIIVKGITEETNVIYEIDRDIEETIPEEPTEED